MADEPQAPLDPRVVGLVREAIARGIPRAQGYEEPLDKPPTLTGRDAALMRETARQMVDERLRERHLLSEMEIKGVAKEIAHAIVERAVGGIRNDLRTEEQIEGIALDVVVNRLRAVGIRADDDHLDETRDVLVGVQKSFLVREERAADFVKELLKALAGWLGTGALGAFMTYLALRGSGH